MPPVTDMAEVMGRLEQASEGSRELDEAIWELLGAYEPGAGTSLCRPYTTSIDAALALVPEGWDWQLGLGAYGSSESKCGAGPVWAFVMPQNIEQRRRIGGPDGDILWGASTPALALCIAALRARHS